MTVRPILTGTFFEPSNCINEVLNFPIVARWTIEINAYWKRNPNEEKNVVYVFIRSTNMQYIAISQPFLFKVYLISVLPHIANHSKILILARSFKHQSCLIYLAGRLVWKTLSMVLIVEPFLPNFHDTLSPPFLENIFFIFTTTCAAQ